MNRPSWIERRRIGAIVPILVGLFLTGSMRGDDPFVTDEVSEMALAPPPLVLAFARERKTIGSVDGSKGFLDTDLALRAGMSFGKAAETSTNAGSEENLEATADSSDGMEDSPLWTPDPRRFTVEPWRFTINVYGWLPQIPATIEINHGDVQLPEKSDEILDDLQFTVMADLQVRKGPFGVYASPIVLFLDDTEHVQGPIQRHRVSIDEAVLLLDFGVSYEVGRWHLVEFAEGSRVTREGNIPVTPNVTAEPFVGARWLTDDIRIDLDPGPSFSPDVHFIAPVFGLRTLWDLSEHFVARIEADYGGFDTDHLKETYNFTGALGYRWTGWSLSWAFFAGYRYLHLHYKKTAEIKATIKGPFVGIGVHF